MDRNPEIPAIPEAEAGGSLQAREQLVLYILLKDQPELYSEI